MSDVDTLTSSEETVHTGQSLDVHSREMSVMRTSDTREQLARTLTAKLILPHQGFVLSRPRLRALVEPVRGGGVICLVAGPGYGKTAFITDTLSSESEARTSLEETEVISRRLGLTSSLAPSLFYLGWLHARAGRELAAGRALGECMRLAAKHDHIHFFSQEARVAVPVLALCERFETGSFVRERIVPRLPDRLQGYFHHLAEGKTYPTDVELGPPRRRAPSPQTPVPTAGGELNQSTLAGIKALTNRECEVLKMIALGMPNKVIAAKLFISEKTVKTHANHLFRKLGVTSRLQATLVFQSYSRACGPRFEGRRAGS